MNGCQLRVFRDLHALQALGEDEQALVGHAHDLVHHRQAARRRNRSVGCGESTRASRWATTTMVLSSPRELINWTELSRPTVRGSTACGNSTVSRTGSSGSVRASVGVVAELGSGIGSATLALSC